MVGNYFKMAARSLRQVRQMMGIAALLAIFIAGMGMFGLVLLAIVLGVPLAFVLMRRWLEGFTYGIDLSRQTFVFTGLLAVAIA